MYDFNMNSAGSSDVELGDRAIASPLETENEEDGKSGTSPTPLHTPDTENNQHATSPFRQTEDVLPRDRQQRTATYNYAFEKSMSHAEAKLFYQRHQQNSRASDGDVSQSPVNSRYSSSLKDEDISSAAVMEHSQLLHNITSDPSSLSMHGTSVDPLPPSALNNTSQSRSLEERLIEADISARKHSLHAGLPHEYKPNLLASQGIHGAGAGIGIGQGSQGFAASDEAVTAELQLVCSKIQKLLDKRHKYLQLSLQTSDSNPRDQPGWRIYPPPPEPAWIDDKERIDGGPHLPALENGSSFVPTINRAEDHAIRPQMKRKMGQDIGEDFDMVDLLPLPKASRLDFRLDESSVYQVHEVDSDGRPGPPIVKIPSLRDFYMDLDTVTEVSTDGPIKSFAFKRLSYLEGKFQLHALLNEYQEVADSKKVPHRDFYNVRKVDTHVHHSACMNQKHLLRFIKSKMKKSPDEIVLFRDGRHLTLKEVFESINLTAYDLSIDTLDMHVSDSTHRRCQAFLLN